MVNQILIGASGEGHAIPLPANGSWFAIRPQAGHPEQSMQAERDEAMAFAQAGVRFRASSAPSGPVLDRFFEGYDQAFVLPNEKEDLAGFRQCLALNAGDEHARLVRRFGPFREMILVAEDDDGGLIGGANFICYPLPAAPAATQGAVLSANLNYAYVTSSFRRRGHLKTLLDAVRETARRLFLSASQPRLLLFLEMNDPMRLDAEAYALDSRHSGLDQMRRIEIWARLGTRIIDHAYAQPALSADRHPDDTLLYGVIGAPGPTLPACLLRGHLERYFGISVLKGRDPLADAAAGPQLRELATLCDRGGAIELLDLSASGKLAASISPESGGTSLRDVLRSLRASASPP